MAGMTFNFYQEGIVTPLIGASIVKPLPAGVNATTSLSGIALRNMSDPSADGHSINYVQNFTITLDPHASSGVPNRVSGCPTG